MYIMFCTSDLIQRITVKSLVLTQQYLVDIYHMPLNIPNYGDKIVKKEDKVSVITHFIN